MKTRILHTKFWEDPYILSLTPTERLFFNFLLTNSHVGLSGVYECPNQFIGMGTGLNMSSVQQIKEKFQKDNKFAFYKGYVKVINDEKYNNYKGEKNEVARNRELELISDTVLNYFDTLSPGYPGVPDTSINHKSEIINQKSETKKKKKFEEKVEKAFGKFWDVYPRKSGKKQARITFGKAFKGKSTKKATILLNQIVDAVRSQMDSEQWEDIKYIPLPATWLNQERWEDVPLADCIQDNYQRSGSGGLTRIT